MEMCEGFHINALGFILKVLEFYVNVRGILCKSKCNLVNDETHDSFHSSGNNASGG